MPYEWQGSSPLRRSESDGDSFVEVGETFEPTEGEKESFTDLLEYVEADDADANPGDEGEEPTEEAPSDEFGGEVPLEDKDYSELRQMAMDADTDEINGRSSKDEIIAYFSE